MLNFVESSSSTLLRQLHASPSAPAFLHALSVLGMRYAVLVTGPAGAGKSTFCNALITHAQTLGRLISAS